MGRDPRPDLPDGPEDVAEATARLQAIAAPLPEVSERLSHGATTCFVRGKRTVCHLTDDHHGDGLRRDVEPDWDQVADIVVAASRQVAARTLVRQLDGG